MPFFNPNGHDWAMNYNLDGWGITQIAFAVLYTLFLLVCIWILWQWRTHPVIRMRKPALTISAVLVLHVYIVLALLVYAWNGHFPCTAEFWIMSIYLPIGIGLFQAQNQVLLLVSRGQHAMLTQDTYKPLPSGKNRRQYYESAFRIWCRTVKQQDIFEGFLAAGMVLQFVVSLFIFLISRRFNSYGFVSQPTTPGLCRRGWEWAPSIIWQAVWNYIAGPFLLYKIRMIHDIYNWRLQTTLAILASLPGTPLWLAAVYSDKLSAVNKYWIPALWLVVPGLISMQLVALMGPLDQIRKMRRSLRERARALRGFDKKTANGTAAPTGSVTTTTTTSTESRSSNCITFSMESLNDCIHNQTSDFEPFHRFCASICFCGENVAFLEKTVNFKREWDRVFSVPDQNVETARLAMYRVAVHIYLTLVHDNAARYNINVEGPIKVELDGLFRAVAERIAADRPTTSTTAKSAVTPWDEPVEDPLTGPGTDHPLRALTRQSVDKSSSTDLITEVNSTLDADDAFAEFAVPVAFSEFCFDRAMDSIKTMLFQQQWQRYMQAKHDSTPAA